MAKLPSKTFTATGPTGEKMSFSAEISVDSKGEFALVIPDELAETAQGLLRDRSTVHTRRVIVDRPRVNHRVVSNVLEDAEHFIRDAMKAHLAADVTIDRVICYAHDVNVAYWEDPDGTIHPNGYAGVPSEQGGTWRGNLNATNHAPSYTVGLWAHVYDRHTIVRGAHRKVTFEKPADIDHFDVTSPTGRLNAFTGLHRKPSEATPSMPYTDDAALFFVDMLTRMCALARGLNAFMGDPAKLQHAIATGTSPLMVGNAKKSANA